MNYVDSFVLAVPKKNLPAYKKLAKKAGKLWMKHGALSYVECVADDVKKGKVTSFPQAVQAKPGEVVVVAYATYKSRADRDKIMKKVMSDPDADMDMKNAPFDGMRMFWGGFKPLVKL